MTGRIYLCTTDDTCPRHGKYLYYCPKCHDEWASAAKAERTQEPTP